MLDKENIQSAKSTLSNSNRNNDKKIIKVSEKERIEIFKKTTNFLSNYPRIRAILIKPKEKTPFEPEWQKKNNYPVTSKIVLNHFLNGGNWGTMHPSGMSCEIDGDTPEIRKAALSLGDTTEWNTGTPGHYCELFIIKDEPVGNIPLVNGAYIRGKGGQNVAPGSIHPNGNIYGGTYLHLVPPVEVTKEKLLEVFKPYIIGKEKLSKKPENTNSKPINPDSLTMKGLVDVTGFKQSGSKYQGAHPVHGSSTGTNFVVDFELNEWHCFRHGTGGGPLQWIAVATGVINCSESVPGKIKGDLFWKVIAAAHNKYGLSYEKLSAALGGDQNGKQKE